MRKLAEIKAKKILFLQQDDFKSKNWASFFPEKFEVRYFSAAWTSVFVLVSLLAKEGKLPAGFVFRYLNCRPRLMTSIFLLCSELSLLLIAFVLRIRIIWICHNVDRETVVHHPSLSKVRRWLFSRFSAKILVTAPGLIAVASECLGVPKSKIGTAVFGPPNIVKCKSTPKECYDRIIRFAEEQRRNAKMEHKISLIGLCAGHPGKKFIHFDLAGELVSAPSQKYFVSLILIGPLRTEFAKRCHPNLESNANHNRILLIGEKISLNEAELTDHFDFIWRGYSDFSISYTLFTAAKINKPVLATDTGFVGKFVAEEKLGATIKLDFVGLDDALEKIRAYNDKEFSEFWERYSWKQGSKEIISNFQ